MRTRWPWFTVVAICVAAAIAGWFVSQGSGNDGDGRPTAGSIQRAMAEDAAKPRFTGRLGPFDVVSPNDPALAGWNGIGCATTLVPQDDSLRSSELWSDAFGDAGIGWACPEFGVIIVNNEGPTGEGVDTGDGSVQIRAYYRSPRLTVGRDAPRDRLELIDVKGYPALLEHPVPGYPYGKASLAVIERAPQIEGWGIAVFVDQAPSVGAAIKEAEALIPGMERR